MDFNHKKDVENKRESAGFFSRLLFLWMIPLFWKGRKKEIDIDDLDNVPVANKAEPLSEQLQGAWNKECTKALKIGKSPNLFKTFLRTFGKRYFMFVGMFAIDAWVVRVSQPLFLKYFIRSFSDETPIEWQCIYAGGVCLSTLLHILLNHPTAFQMCVSGMRCRVAVSSMIYRKALRLSKAAEGKASVGQIVNLLSNDVSRFDYNLHFIAFIFVGPVQLFLFFYILWEELGIACLAGVGYVLLLSPSQYLIGKLSAIFRVQIGKQTDERSRMMSEIIVAMRLIKQYAWEKPFAAIIKNIRRLEVKALKKRSYLRASFMGVFTSNFTFVPFLAILTYGLLGNAVTPDKAFFAVAVFNVMTEVMMYYVPNAAASVGELKASIKRLEEFLLMEEQVGSKNLRVDSVTQNNKPPSVKMENVSCRWTETKMALKDLSLDISGDKIIMVVGPVGSGKTSFLQCLLAELPIDSGHCNINGSISYASQEAWIFPGTIQQNVLLGKEFNREKYNRVVGVCALDADLKQLKHSDMTIVGERGVSLSGGQKARVNLARALYQDATIYLLDDPLSAVDTSVSRHIFEKCIQTHLKGHLRILVTHQLQYLPQADHVIVLDDGKIVASGSYKDLMERGIDFVNLLAREDETSKPEKKEDLTEEVDLNEDTDAEKMGEGSVQNPNREAMAEGSVGFKTYWGYYKSGESVCGMTFLFTAFIFNQIIISFTDYWLSLWTASEEKNVPRFKRDNEYIETNPSLFNDSSTLPPLPINDDDFISWDFWNFKEWDRDHYMYAYIGLACTVFLIDTIRTFYYFAFTMKISTNIHNRMFNSLVRAPISFFDENSSGRIMNRFTKDIGTLDENLPLSMFDTLDIGHRTVGCMLIVLILNYYLILPAAILLIAFSYIRKLFIRTSRNIKRVETCTRSPLYTHLSSSVTGLATIRCLKAQKILISQFDCHQDMHSAAWFHFLAGNNWFSIWLELASTVFITCVVYSFVILSGTSDSFVGQVGLAVASLLQLMNTFQFGMRQSSEMENFMTSVERTLEYTKLDAEVSKTSNKYSDEDKKVPKNWPANGAISMKNMYLSYDGGETFILKNLSLEIKSNENIGIVGRTGAGKSSIIAALFRLTECEGEISIDGYDISGVSLKKLRKSISIIPQDPTLFSGTIRYNLDPFNKFTDEELWKVLQEVELKDLITALDYQVNEGGKNFSVGQRQLVCLARAILRKNNILIMDEATANCDPRTDNLIQNTIRKKLSDSTTITVAHRLHSVMDCDKILVLEMGEMMEYDHPHILLQNEKGLLTKLASHTGKSSFEMLKQIAKRHYFEHNRQ